MFFRVIAVAALLWLSACASVPVADTSDYPEPIVAEPLAQPSGGAIYASNSNVFLFEDVRARRVGDVINVELEERTDATKTASTTTNKGSSVDLPSPTVFGGPAEILGRDVFENQISTGTEFMGSGDSSQSNRLSGSVAVTVVKRLPNGNLLIRGSKTLTLNQGSEVVKVSGQIRPADISPDNTIKSSQIADAQISYGGRGVLAEANSAGWLTRIFQSSLWPF